MGQRPIVNFLSLTCLTGTLVVPYLFYMLHKTIPKKHYKRRLKNFKIAQRALLANGEAYTYIDKQITHLESILSTLDNYNSKMRVRNYRIRLKKEKKK